MRTWISHNMTTESKTDLLPRQVNRMRAPRIPVLPPAPNFHKKHINDAKIVLMALLEHASTFQVTKARLKDETGLSRARLTKSLNYLREQRMVADVPVRKNGRMHGWCFRVDLDGDVQAGGWVLHYSQDRDERRDFGARKRMRRKMAGLPDQDTFKKGKPQRGSEPVGSEPSPLHPYIEEPVGDINPNPLTPLSGGNENEIPTSRVTRRQAEVYASSSTNIPVRLEEAVATINTRKMTDREIESWWQQNIPGRMLDDTLPVGDSFTTAQKRRHMRRMKRSPRYLDLMVWHWAVTRQGVARMPAEALTTGIIRMYTISPQQTDRDGTMNAFTLVHAYRRVCAANGAEWNLVKPRAVGGIHGLEKAAIDTLDDSEMQTEMAQLPILLPTVERATWSRESNDAALARFVRLRAWVLSSLGGAAAAAFEAHCERLRLTPATNPVLRHWCHTSSAGRKFYEASLKMPGMTPARLRQVFGFLPDEWLLEFSDHAARCVMLDSAFANLQWDQKTLQDYAVF